jgi:hypothetical protein
MPGVRDLLDRFRPAGAPGAATGAGVPVDRRAGAEAELEPVFAALAATARECAGIRARARQEADRLTRSAAEQAELLVARARAAEQAERAAAASALRRDAQADLAAVAAAAERTADRVRREAEEHMPGLVAAVRDRVRAELTGLAAQRSEAEPR